jgi:hypothetical protein
MEYKADEVWTFEQTQPAALGQGNLWLGMKSSVNVPNPGMSLWVFIALRTLAGAEDPPALTRAVQLANCLALGLLVVFIWRQVPARQREAWLWAAALAAVNPLTVLFHRKLWPPCVLPLLSLAALWGWWRRGRPWPAFVWGLVGACLGQIHMAGFFFSAGFGLWALCFDRKGVAWKWWLFGSCLGAVPLIPWAAEVLAHPSAGTASPIGWVHALEGKFWGRWFTESFGLGIDYTLGAHFREFLGWPLVGDTPTYLVALCHAVIVGVAAFLLCRQAVWLWRGRRSLAGNLIGRESPTAFTQGAALWGFGLLMTLSCLPIHRHYMIVLFPLECLWVARLALQQPAGSGPRAARAGRILLGTLWAAQLLISTQFLAYIHDTQNVHAEYGPTYHAQQQHKARLSLR